MQCKFTITSMIDIFQQKDMSILNLLTYILEEFKKNGINKFILDDTCTYYMNNSGNNGENNIEDIKFINQRNDDKECEVLFFNFTENTNKHSRQLDIEFTKPPKPYKKFKKN